MCDSALIQFATGFPACSPGPLQGYSPGMRIMTAMELRRLVEGVTAVRATSKKTEKTQMLANLLKQAQGRDIELVALYLVGTLPQGRIGIGWRIIEQASADLSAADASLSLHQIDQMLDGIATDEGAGS